MYVRSRTGLPAELLEEVRATGREAAKRWRETHPRWAPEMARKVKYNLNPQRYNHLLIEQCGRCACCGYELSGPKDPVVDHDHGSLHIRGLLCDRCNRALGFFEDRIDLLERAVAYLIEAEDRPIPLGLARPPKRQEDGRRS
jgi:hypothetical protein